MQNWPLINVYKNYFFDITKNKALERFKVLKWAELAAQAGVCQWAAPTYLATVLKQLFKLKINVSKDCLVTNVFLMYVRPTAYSEKIGSPYHVVYSLFCCLEWRLRFYYR